MKKTLCVASVLGLLLFAGCGGSGEDTPSADTTSFEAAVVGVGRVSGKLTVTIDTHVASSVSRAETAGASGTVTARGSLTLTSGGTVNLAGSYDSAAKTLRLSGEGYTFTGIIDANWLTGTYTGPNGGSGAYTGADSSDGGVAVYCGTHSGNGTPEPFVMIISADGRISGLEESYQPITGTLNGDSISATATIYGTIITGTRTGNTFSGTFSDPATGTTGTWQATRM